MKTLFSFLLTMCCFFTLRVAAQSLPDTVAVTVLSKNDKNEIPKDAIPKGSIKIGDGMRINCGYTETIERARGMARENGANLIKITELKLPDGLSSCYRLRADVYYYSEAATRFAYTDLVADSIARALIPDTASYALLYVYRPRGGNGVLIRYPLYVDDSEVCLVKPGSANVIRLYKPGRNKIWASTESEKSIMLNVKPRKVYFMRAAIQMGVMVGRPALELVSTEGGLREFNKIQEWNEGKRKKRGEKTADDPQQD